MSLKHDMQREMRNIKTDVSKAVERTWTVEHNGQTIEIFNGLMHEKVSVDGVVVAERIRQSMWSHLMPFSTLKGTFTALDGKQHKLYVKLGGFIKLHVTLKIDGQKVFYTTMDFVMNPWDNKEPLVAYIEQQLANGTLSDALPDDALLYDEHHPPKAAGEADQQEQEYVAPTHAKKVVQLLLTQCKQPSDKARKALYEKIIDEPVVSFFPQLLEEMSQSEYDEQTLKKEALWLLEHATHREAVKFAIVMLGFAKCEDEKERLQTIAHHEEFTGVVLFALRNGATGANTFAFELAKKLTGWGRVAAIDFMEGNTPELKHWLVTEGYKTRVAPTFVAMLCIEKGKLDVMLHEKEISADIFDGASHLITNVLNYSFERIDTYEYAGQLFSRFTYHAKQHAKTLQHLDTLIHMTVYMDRDEVEWQELYGFGWKPHERNLVNDNIAQIFATQPLKDEALAIIASGAEDDEAALEVAAYYGEPVTDAVLSKLQQKPTHLHYYAVILNSEDRVAIQRAIDFIRTAFTFDTLSPQQLEVVQFIVSNLHDFVGVGEQLLIDCLHRDKELQYYALLVVESWTKEQCSDELLAAVQHVASHGEIKAARQFAKHLLTNDAAMVVDEDK